MEGTPQFVTGSVIPNQGSQLVGATGLIRQTHSSHRAILQQIAQQRTSRLTGLLQGPRRPHFIL